MIRDVTEALMALLATGTPDLGSWIQATSLHGGAGAEPTADKLHVCLYAVEEHGHLRNLPPVLTGVGYRRPPLALRLHYLVTYISTDHLESQARLARVAEVLFRHPVLGPETIGSRLAERVGHVTVRMRDPGTEERGQIWTALGRPMRLALYYDVDVAPIDHLEPEGGGVIARREIVYGIADRQP